MTIQVTEKPESRAATEGRNSTVERIYNIVGTEETEHLKEHDAALAALRLEAPAEDGDLLRDALNIEPVGPGIWRGTVRYVPVRALPRPEPEAETTIARSFEISSDTMHITQSRRTVSKGGLGGDDPPDFKGAIGVTHDSIEGCDIEASIYRFSETHYREVSQMTATYQGKIFALRGKMNHAGFRDFAAGEVRFLGARGQWRDDEELAEITFEFAALPNRKEIKIPDIENVAPRIRIGNGSAVVKRGWDYLWVHYRPVLDDTLKMIIQLPYAAYVEEVYETGDFGTLEI